MNFRKVLVALAALVLFAGLASAQLPVSQTLSCSVSADTAPTIRAEGVTELVGDLKITCTGGPAQVGTAADIGYVKLVVDMGVPVTSRAIGYTATASGVTTTAIEAVVLVDEAGLTGGAFAAQTVCAKTAAACAANTVVVGVPETIAGFNTFQGYVKSDKPNQIVFDSIPVLTLGSATYQHIFRVANVRVTPGSSPVVATVAATANTGSLIGMTLSNNSATVATPAATLATSYVAPGISLCNTTDLAGTVGSPNLALLTFAEKVNKVFKTAAGEAGTVTTILAAGDAAATSGTRLKAVFTGLDPNVTYYVSLNNVADFKTASPAASIRAALIAQAATNQETQGAFAAAVAGQNAWGNVPAIALTVSATGGATAVWEVTNPDGTNLDSYTFAVYAVYNTVTAPPTASTASKIQLGYAPTTASTGAASTWIPRFAAPGAATSFAPILPCQTSLLFPFITNQAGFNTGIAISNTSKDPFSTQSKDGACTLSFYGANAPAAVTTSSVAAGTTYVALASDLSPLFQGYMVAVCNFKLAHGFAFVQGAPGQNNSTAMGYLPLVLTGDQRGTVMLGESQGM